MKDESKNERLTEIKTQVTSFGQQHLNEELTGYALELTERVGRKRVISITRGKTEIWSAAIIYVIARLNFLFDKADSNHITPDTIADFFQSKKSTISQKATTIENACKIYIGEAGLCRPVITNSLEFVQTPEGFIMPKSQYLKVTGIEMLDPKEAQELEAQLEELERLKEQEAQREKERREELLRQKKEQLREKKFKNQGDLFK